MCLKASVIYTKLTQGLAGFDCRFYQEYLEPEITPASYWTLPQQGGDNDNYTNINLTCAVFSSKRSFLKRACIQLR